MFSYNVVKARCSAVRSKQNNSFSGVVHGKLSVLIGALMVSCLFLSANALVKLPLAYAIAAPYAEDDVAKFAQNRTIVDYKHSVQPFADYKYCNSENLAKLVPIKMMMKICSPRILTSVPQCSSITTKPLTRSKSRKTLLAIKLPMT